MYIVKNRNNFGILLDELKLNGIGIEIGVASGNYSEILLNNTKLKKIYFLDPWKAFPEYGDYGNQLQCDERYAFVVKRLDKYKDRVVIIRKDSIEALSDFQDAFFDFIYIDANHGYDYVKKDITNWYPKLRKGGIFSGHDYANIRGFGVCRAVDEFCKAQSKTLTVTGGVKRYPPSWYLIK